MAEYQFLIYIHGEGNDKHEAWENAIESFLTGKYYPMPEDYLIEELD